MEKSTLIVLVTVLIVVTVLGTCIGFLGFAVWEDFQLQQGELVPDGGELEITFWGFYFEESAGFEGSGECFLIGNVTNRNNFGIAWIGIDLNYTENGENGTAFGFVKRLKPYETKHIFWDFPSFYSPDECCAGRFKDFEIAEIMAYKYKD
ncbi:MAG: hypothetical protein KAT65_13560 [Methanophagales archaeon]|nr:hypothetical protein [Methanophagales archaeon]